MSPAHREMGGRDHRGGGRRRRYRGRTPEWWQWRREADGDAAPVGIVVHIRLWQPDHWRADRHRRDRPNVRIFRAAAHRKRLSLRLLDATPFENATINVTVPSSGPVFIPPCPVHTATPEELTAAKDPLTGFVGLSFIGFGAAGLPPGALLEVTLRAPDGQIRTGRGVADARGCTRRRGCRSTCRRPTRS